MKPIVAYEHSFELLDIRVGTIVSAQLFERAKKPSYKIEIDFGNEIGIKKSSAQITHHYDPHALIGNQVIAVINFPGRNIGGYISEVLVLGVYDELHHVILLKPDRNIANGAKIG